VLTIPTYSQPELLTGTTGTLFGIQNLSTIKTYSLDIKNYDIEVHMLQVIDSAQTSTPVMPLGLVPPGLSFFALRPYNSSYTALTSNLVMGSYLSDAVPFGLSRLSTESGYPGSLPQDPQIISPQIYKMGAVVPPLVYPKESQFRVDVCSLIGDCIGPPYNWVPNYNTYIVLTGFQRIPC
jgi:hypothetical protein